MTAMSSEDLGLMPTDALIEALCRRYDGAVFIAARHCGDGTTDYKMRWTGPSFQAIGLAQFVANDIAADVRESQREATEET